MFEKLTHFSLTLVYLLVSTALSNCIAAKKTNDDKNAFESLVRAELREKFTVDYNKSKTYALCQQKRSDDHLRRSFKYIVVRTQDNTVVHEGNFSMGYVQWHDENSIEVFQAASSANDSGNKKIVQINSAQL
jgi:adenosine deaminase